MAKAHLKRNGGFYLREGWLTKGISLIDQGIRLDSISLGVGKNMVPAIKHYLRIAGLAKINSNRTELEPLGEEIRHTDRYFEKTENWWKIHLNLILEQREENTLFWYFFNNISLKEVFSKKDLCESFKNFLDVHNFEYNESYIENDVNVLLKMYSDNDEDRHLTPEETRVCPLTQLGLLNKIGDSYQRCSLVDAPLSIVEEYLFRRFSYARAKDTLELSEVLLSLEALNLDGYSSLEKLEELKKNGSITLDRTAGLNVIKLVKQ